MRVQVLPDLGGRGRAEEREGYEDGKDAHGCAESYVP